VLQRDPRLCVVPVANTIAARTLRASVFVWRHLRTFSAPQLIAPPPKRK
jgi:hypothetical protein